MQNMYEMPNMPSNATGPSAANPQGGDPMSSGPMMASQPTYYMPPETKSGNSKWLLAVFILGMAVVVAGIVFGGSSPKQADATPMPVDYKTMSSQQLADNAGVEAAQELTKRFMSDDEAVQTAAADAIDRNRTPRLQRNLAMAMAQQQQKLAREQMLRVQKAQREMMEADGPMPGQ